MVVEAINKRVASLLERLSEASSVPKEVVLEEALKLWAAARELDVEGPQNDEEPMSCDVAYPLGSSEVYYSPISQGQRQLRHHVQRIGFPVVYPKLHAFPGVMIVGAASAEETCKPGPGVP